MPNEVLMKSGTPIVWADTTDYSSTNSGFTRTAQIDLTGIASNAARQGDKVDLGATRARQFSVRVGFEFQTAPTAGTLVEVYWSASVSATAGTGNDGGASGADGAYKASEEDEWKQQLWYIGALVATNDGNTTPQFQTISNNFVPAERYGMPVVVNKTNQSLNTADAIEMFIALVPLVDEVQ